jgi:hypothetical protein
LSTELEEETIKGQISHKGLVVPDEDRQKWSEMGKKIQQNYQSTTVRESKKSKLLVNPEVKRWYDNLSRGSRLTAKLRLLKMARFCEQHQITPLQLVELGTRDIRTLTNMLEDYVTSMKEKGRAPSYIQSIVTAVKSWLEHFEIRITRKIKVGDVDSTPTLENERVPEPEELAEMFSRANLRVGAIESLISKAGLRPQVLGNDDATDGLMMKDLPHLVIQQGLVRCLQNPPMIIVRKSLSKARHQYFTFLTPMGTQRLLAYLNDRLIKGDVLNAESPVIAPDMDHSYGRRNNNDKKFLPTKQITDLMRASFRPRFGWRPYVLRAYFDTQLLIVESKGKIAHDFRVFFMGHKGSIEAKYTTNKSRLPDTLLNEMKEAFRRSEEFLDLEAKPQDPLLNQKEYIQQAINSATPEKVQEMLRILGVCNTPNRE